jgi:hypothetical protein
MESTNKKTTRDYKEMLLLKGIGSELEKMAYPKVANLNAMLETMGYSISPISTRPVRQGANQDEYGIKVTTEDEVKSSGYKY